MTRDKLEHISLVSSPKKTRNIRARYIYPQKTPFTTDERLFDVPSLPGKPGSQAPDAIKSVYHGRAVFNTLIQKGFSTWEQKPWCVSSAPKRRLISFCERASGGGREKGHNILRGGKGGIGRREGRGSCRRSLD